MSNESTNPVSANQAWIDAQLRELAQNNPDLHQRIMTSDYGHLLGLGSSDHSGRPSAVKNLIREITNARKDQTQKNAPTIWDSIKTSLAGKR